MLNINLLPTESLSAYANNARTHSAKQISQIARSIKDFGFTNPILIDESSTVMAGHGRLMAAKKLGITEVPTIQLSHLSDAQKTAYILADNKLAEKAGWDSDILKIELQNLLTFDIDFDLTMTGFETPEIDLIINDPARKDNDPLDALPSESEVTCRTKSGDLWALGEHRLLCGDSLDTVSFEKLLGDKKADLVFTDGPYNMVMDKYACGHGEVTHEEFAYASGEMTQEQFKQFLTDTLAHLIKFSKDGSIHYVCMDWRNNAVMMDVGAKIYTELKNICVWNKLVGGMGSQYRSQHEFVYVFKNGRAPHVNNIELGKHGRCRTNVWDYAGVNSAGGHSQDLKLHPTVKPTQMIADAIVDSSRRGEIILDCFGGSGSTILAAEKVKRVAYLIEYEPRYCDVALARYKKMTGRDAVLINGAHNG